ncbi:hypothetical protein NPIL_482241 [Nephila pilipes]|uniref:Uncharacterized protein n=1 Tax=Nephila pilipes TaxID=299642 RepID=A0A8X6IJN4_NEPPI|nr:hypothetical protein NPIL_482241 [Nephila pilipes]
MACMIEKRVFSSYCFVKDNESITEVLEFHRHSYVHRNQVTLSRNTILRWVSTLRTRDKLSKTVEVYKNGTNSYKCGMHQTSHAMQSPSICSKVFSPKPDFSNRSVRHI